eukprot:TRINITY_DN8232_c0_g1_i1.p2 TRINITY_DN8232_c0_g1~~TRINITY_DN8232_c0_g1_i1.p2  ORF type:complete len:213 (+),score=62.96 TRINITY_DN8232_c0_g1_i1:79-717(+)
MLAGCVLLLLLASNAEARVLKKRYHLVETETEQKDSTPSVGRGTTKKGEDYNLLGGVLSDPNIIKAMLPKTFVELFDLAEMLLPGMKTIQDPLIKTITNMWPVLDKAPGALEEMAPTFKEIISDVKTQDASDEDFIRWGKSLLDSGGELLRDWMKASEASPISELIKTVHELKLVDKIKSFLEGDQLATFLHVVSWVNRMVKSMADIHGVQI